MFPGKCYDFFLACEALKKKLKYGLSHHIWIYNKLVQHILTIYINIVYHLKILYIYQNTYTILLESISKTV